jgi:hypothetical protein
MKDLFIKLLLVIAIIGYQSADFKILAGEDNPDFIKIKKCKDFTVTGDGSSDTWKSTEWINIIQRTSRTDIYHTKAKVLYSETGIYFLFDCEDKKLNSTMKADYLDLWNEDVVEVFLWTQEDFPVYFEYELSPLNYELPIIIPNYKGKFFGWLPWHYEGNRRTQHATSTRDGKKESGSTISAWMAEIFIPYRLLTPLQQVPPLTGTKWRANLYRIDYDQGETLFSWQKIDKSFHEYEKFGTFIFE